MSPKKNAADIEQINRSRREENIERWKAMGHDLVRISRHSGSCPNCQPFEGRTFSLSGCDEEFPPLDTARAGGLFHPGCLHVLSLVPEEKERFIGRLQGKEGEAAKQAEIDRLATKWNEMHPPEKKKGLRKWLGI